MVTGVNSQTGANGSTDAPKPKTDSTSDLANRDTFLKLLVAQIKNQDPLSPTDGVQFLSQLAQFTQVEQSTQMRDDLTQIRTLIQKEYDAQQTAAASSTKKS